MMYNSHNNNNLLLITTLNNVAKTFRRTWYLNKREVAILISARQVEKNNRWPLRCFSFTDLRKIHDDTYYPYEIYRSVKQLCENDYVQKKSWNTYRITLKGHAALRHFKNLFVKESKRLGDFLHKEKVI